MSDTRLRDIEREHAADPSLGTLRRLADERKRCGEEMLPVAWDADGFTRTWPVASWTWFFSSLVHGYLPSWNAQSRAWELRHTRFVEPLRPLTSRLRTRAADLLDHASMSDADLRRYKRELERSGEDPRAVAAHLLGVEPGRFFVVAEATSDEPTPFLLSRLRPPKPDEPDVELDLVRGEPVTLVGATIIDGVDRWIAAFAFPVLTLDEAQALHGYLTQTRRTLLWDMRTGGESTLAGASAWSFSERLEPGWREPRNGPPVDLNNVPGRGLNPAFYEYLSYQPTFAPWTAAGSVTVRVGDHEQRVDLTPGGPVDPRSPASSPPPPEA